MPRARTWAGLSIVALILAACSTGGGATTAPTTSAPATSAPGTSAPGTDAPETGAPGTDAPSGGMDLEGEGELNIVIWGGYAEKGETLDGFDWVTPFQEQTGCTVNATAMTDSNNGVSLMQSGEYDGISASGDATTRLIQGGLVEEIDTSEYPNYANVFPGLKDLPHNTVDGKNYGVPHGRGPNLMMWNTEEITEAPTSWDAVWEGGADYAGKISIYDSSIYIADAAVHLMATQPDLGIEDPYQLNEEQFAAAIELLEQQAANQPLYWGSYTDQIASFTAGDVVVGTTWPLQVQLLQAENVPVEGVKPDEGTTGWSDTWMLAKNAAHPNCMKMWMNHMMSPEANAQATVFFGEAATSPQACEAAEALAPGHCESQHADEESYWENIYYWSTPQEDCKDEDPATTCKTQADWVDAWNGIRGS